MNTCCVNYSVCVMSYITLKCLYKSLIGGLCVGCITLDALVTYSRSVGATRVRDAVPGRDEDPGGHKMREFHKCPSHV